MMLTRRDENIDFEAPTFQRNTISLSSASTDVENLI